MQLRNVRSCRRLLCSSFSGSRLSSLIRKQVITKRERYELIQFFLMLHRQCAGFSTSLPPVQASMGAGGKCQARYFCSCAARPASSEEHFRAREKVPRKLTQILKPNQTSLYWFAFHALFLIRSFPRVLSGSSPQVVSKEPSQWPVVFLRKLPVPGMVLTWTPKVCKQWPKPY